VEKSGASTQQETGEKQIGRYVNECTARLNDADVERHTLDSLNGFVDATAGQQFTYEDLTA
jgi:hypothetical protein